MLDRRMKNECANHATLSDAELLTEVHRLVRCERAATARLIEVLAELDARRLYLAEGCSSLFTYCTQVLHLSEHAAYGRIEAARAARKWPVVLDMLADGSLRLTAISLLSRHLTSENCATVLAAARHKSKRQVEEIVAALQPQPPAPSGVRKLPTPSAEMPAAVPDADTTNRLRAVSNLLSPARRTEVKPLAPEQYKVQFTASRETYNKRRQAQDLLRHRIPTGDVATIVDRALTLLLAELHKAKHAAVDRPRVRRHRRALHRAWLSGVSPRGAIRGWRRDGCGQSRVAMSSAQRL